MPFSRLLTMCFFHGICYYASSFSLTLITWYVCINFYVYKKIFGFPLLPARSFFSFFHFLFFFVFPSTSRILAVSLRKKSKRKISSIGKKLACLCLEDVNLQKHNFLLYLSPFFFFTEKRQDWTEKFLFYFVFGTFLGLIEIFKC